MFLKRIVESKKIEVEQAKKNLPLSEVLAGLEHTPAPLDFREALKNPPAKINLIAEIKKASPSKGVLRDDFNPLVIAKSYENSGLVNAISVLTEQQFFQGSLDYLQEIKKQVKLPILRKDFIIDVYQLYESRVYGADAVLLIVGLLSLGELQYFLAVLKHLGMEALVEVHDKKELETALKAGAQVIGINNRNLKTFETNLEVTFGLRPYIPEGITVVSESGIEAFADVQLLINNGINAMLVGEYFMRCQDIPAGVQALVAGIVLTDV